MCAKAEARAHARERTCCSSSGVAYLREPRACIGTVSVEALDQRALIKTAVVRAVARAVARAASHLRFIRPKIHKIPSIVLKDPLFGIPCRCEE